MSKNGNRESRKGYIIGGAAPGVVLGILVFILSWMAEDIMVGFVLGAIVTVVLGIFGVVIGWIVWHILHLGSSGESDNESSESEKKKRFFEQVRKIIKPIYAGKFDKASNLIQSYRNKYVHGVINDPNVYVDVKCLENAKKFVEYYKYSSKPLPRENSEYDNALKNWLVFKDFGAAKACFLNSIEKEEGVRALAVCDYIDFISQTESKLQAIKKLEKYIELYGKQTEFLEKAVVLYSQTDDIAKLRETLLICLEELSEKKSDSKKEIGILLLRLADCEYRLGDFGKSIETASKALKSGCWKAGYAKQVVDSYIAMSEYREARFEMKRNILSNKIYSFLMDKIDLAESNKYSADNKCIYDLDNDKFIDSVLPKTQVDKYNLKYFSKITEYRESVETLQNSCNNYLSCAYITKHLYGKTEEYYGYLSQGLLDEGINCFAGNKYDMGCSFCLSAIKTSVMIKNNSVENQAIQAYFGLPKNVPRDFMLQSIKSYIDARKSYEKDLYSNDVVQVIKYSPACREYCKSEDMGYVLYVYIDEWFNDAERKFKCWLDTVKKNIDFKEDLKNAANEVKDSVLTFESDKEFIGRYLDCVSRMDEFYKYDDFDNRKAIVSQVLSELKGVEANVKKDNFTTMFFENYLEEVFSATIDNLEKLVDRVRDEMATKLTIDLPVDKLIPDESGNAILSVKITNAENRAPAKEMKLFIENTAGEMIFQKDLSEKNLKGGASVSELVKFNAKGKEALGIKIKVSYKGGFVELLKQVTIDSADFEEINNPYITGNPVEKDDMLFGRDELIKRLELSLKDDRTRCIVIYGQKRSGKSSIFEHLKRRLVDKFIVVDFTLLSDVANEQYLYKCIQKNLCHTLRQNQCDKKIVEALKNRTISDFLDFEDFIHEVIEGVCEPENKELLLMIDEFTRIYEFEKQGDSINNFMDKWKAMVEKNFFKSALIGQVNMPEFIREYPNQFQVTDLIRVSYLEKKYAIDLIVKPILLSNGKSRYVDGAEKEIEAWFNGQPYFIQRYCHKLVNYLNMERAKQITLAFAENVKNQMLAESGIDFFDNLVASSETESWSVIEKMAKSEAEEVRKESLNLTDSEEKALEKLIDRDVVQKKPDNKYAIKIPFFREWVRDYK